MIGSERGFIDNQNLQEEAVWEERWVWVLTKRGGEK